MKKPNIFLNILKLLGVIIAGWFLWVVIFAIVLPEEVEGVATEPSDGLLLILGVLTGLVIWMGTAFIGVRKSYQLLRAKKSNIQVVKERGDGLLEKANRVVERYMAHETATQVGVIAVRGTGTTIKGKSIKNSNDFRGAIESYPELKANESVMSLLTQISDCENTVANFKISYNDEVAHYNAKVSTIPGFLRKLLKLDEAEFHGSETNDSYEITDEMLGL